MKFAFPLALLLTLLTFTNCSNNSKTDDLSLQSERATPDGAWEQERKRTQDPELGYPTPERLIPVLEKIKMQKLQEAIPGSSSSAAWVERGPYQVGGRTRAIMFDPNDGTNKKVWAGGVTGGLWYNDDITSASSEWEAVDDFWDNIAVTCIASDPNTTNTFYVGTGEGWNQSASGARGAGIWKTTDGGTTWSQLGSTSDFYFVNDIVVRDESGSSVVYAGVERFFYEGSFHGTSYGLQRSTNGGTSWSQVLPSSGSRPYSVADIELDANGDLWVGTVSNSLGQGGGTILTSDDGTTWTTSETISGGDRVELACAPSDANYVYAIIESGSVVDTMIRTTNGGTSWSAITEPADDDTGIPDDDFSRNQAWYDLIAAVNPTDEDDIIVGGVDLFRSTDGGTTWEHISKWSNNANLNLLTCSEVHADQHQVIYRPGSSTEVVFGNDGGIYYTNDIEGADSTNVIQPRNKGYNVTQFYSGAIYPDAGSNFYLAGSQDNGTQLFNASGFVNTSEATGGDGGFCFIDQDQPDTQITTFTNNNINFSINGGSSFSLIVASATGSFINPADYDDEQNALYSGYSATSIYRTSLATGLSVLNLGLNDDASALKVSPHTTASTTLYVGTESAGLYEVTTADGTPSVSDITGGSFPSGTISCVQVGGSEDTLVATFFNYGVTSIWYTTDGGTSWASREGDLPDMPVRWFLFNPNNSDEAIIATELGVWSTANFQDVSPNWVASTSGLANVRVDMLQIRTSDNQVIASTHGRGLFSSDAFSTSAPLADFGTSTEQAGTSMAVKFTDQSSSNPTSWSWAFTPNNVVYLEGTDASSQNPVVQFAQTGTYEVELTATNSTGSDTETKAGYVSVLSGTAVPHTQNFDAFGTCGGQNFCASSCVLSSDWLNGSNDISDWGVEDSPTGSPDTGPSGDNTTGSDNYLFTEASNCFEGDHILYSPVFNLNAAENPSLSFAYHMYGNYMGTLILDIYDNGDWVSLWSNDFNTGDAWFTEIINLSDYTGQEVLFRFTGTTGEAFTSDMAIDDFSITENLIRWDNGGATTNWSDADNWSNDEVPGEGASVTLDNTFVAGNYTINLNSAQQISGIDIDMGANTVTLSGSDALNTTGVVIPTSGTLAANGQLTLKAVSEIEYGQVDAGSGGSITGNVINEWYYNGRDGYRHVSSPVSCNLSEITADFNRIVFNTGTDGSIWSWDATISDWDVAAGSSDPFTEAFSVFMGTSNSVVFSPLPFTMDATGTLNTGNQNQTLTYSTGTPADFVDPGENSGWNFLFNPYPSILDWEAVAADGGFPAELSTTVYYWDESLGSDGSYASYNASTNTSVNGATEFIAKGQATWIQLSTSPGGGSTTLSLTDAMRSTESTPKPKSENTLGSKIKIIASQSGQKDILRFAHFPEASALYDHHFDHLEMDNGLYALSVRSDAQARKLAYNCMEQYNYPIPFSVHTPAKESITLSFTLGDNFEGEKPNYVKDLTTGEIHELSNGDFTFAPHSKDPNSFLLMHRIDDGEANRAEVTIGSGRGYLKLNLRDYGTYDQAYVFDLSGKLVMQQELDPVSREQLLQLNRTGAFIVHLSGKDGKSYSQKAVLIQ